jgi:hypothetical protein
MNYNEIFKKVFLWMFVGLLITFATGYVVSVSPNMIEKIFSSSMYIILAIIEIALVIILSARITKMNPTTARILFILYSFVTGLTFSSIFIVYEMSSIIYVFLITAIVFGILSFIGYTTNVDLTKMGTYLLIGLIAVLISTIINIFVGNGTFEIIICIISVLVFLGFTAYDVQKIKQLSNYYDENSIAIIGALELYLDFINIFLDLLRLFAKERN